MADYFFKGTVRVDFLALLPPEEALLTDTADEANVAAKGGYDAYNQVHDELNK